MELLVEFDLNVPNGTPRSEVEDRQDAKAPLPPGWQTTATSSEFLWCEV